MAAIPVVRDLTPVDLNARLKSSSTPFVARGIARDWPLVRSGVEGGGKGARDYLLGYARDRSFEVNVGQPGRGGRLFYDSDMQMNFRMGRASLADIFAGIDANVDKPDAPVIYLSSLAIRDYFDGLDDANRIDLGERRTRDSIWIGTRTEIAAHNDLPHNLAVCAVGRRRFTLFPPDSFADLYLGPLENTPAGRAVSMVDLANPDFGRFPRFRTALAKAQAAVLEPGDALFIPSMWYHHVEGLDAFNVLVNYWWRETPLHLGDPEQALLHAILAVRDLPDAARERWRTLFDHYVFSGGAGAGDHLPEGKRGILDPLDPEAAGRLRAFLLRTLSQ
ncbi:cupin-like domain-containing protein [Sphingomonas sp.]|uniref:cupin-like domain-containing protein n=1 Tax=Sphingomonas sp. TaxID=28214 RepID=UPI0025D23176|nr:cupin-like domain-containing protein [Sphingomonas sp.]